MTLKGTLYLLWPNLLVRVIRKNLAEGQSHAHKFALVGGFMVIIGALLVWRVSVNKPAGWFSPGWSASHGLERRVGKVCLLRRRSGLITNGSKHS